jgi:isopenicillin-N epimerase
MGLGLLYGGLELRPGQELLATEHDFYSTHEALRLAADRTGASFRKVPLYHDLRSVSADEIVGRVRRAVGPRTRALAVTWVHSSTGLKLPVRAVADALAEVNRDRDAADRVLLCVDAVHALGVEPAHLPDLGCDFFVAGCHKWLFGPRGTGIVWGRREAWPAVAPTIPTFDGRGIAAWIQGRPPGNLPRAAAMTPGGYHSFEYRWSLAEAFRFHQRIGKARVAERTRTLADQLKQGLRTMPHVRLATPLADELSAGIVCFDVEGRGAAEVVGRLLADRIGASVTPYAVRHVRLGTSIVTSPEDVDRALGSIRALA